LQRYNKAYAKQTDVSNPSSGLENRFINEHGLGINVIEMGQCGFLIKNIINPQLPSKNDIKNKKI